MRICTCACVFFFSKPQKINSGPSKRASTCESMCSCRIYTINRKDKATHTNNFFQTSSVIKKSMRRKEEHEERYAPVSQLAPRHGLVVSVARKK